MGTKFICFTIMIISQTILMEAEENGTPILNHLDELAEDNLAKQTKYHAGVYLINFLKYLNNCGIQSYVPRPPKAVKSQYIPYIFSEDQILKLFETCDNWRDRYYTYDKSCFGYASIITTFI